MRRNLYALPILALCGGLLAGCDTQTPSSSKNPTTTNATASLKIMIQPDGTYDASSSWSIREVTASLSKIQVLKGGQTVAETQLESTQKDLAYFKTFRSREILAGTYDGLNLGLSVSNAELGETVNSEFSTRSVAINVANPLSFNQAVEIPANKRTVMVFKPNYRLMGEPGAFSLTPAAFTIKTYIQEFYSPDGYPMAYLNHFTPFNLEEPEAEVTDGIGELHPGPYGPQGERAFGYLGSEQKPYVDLGEKALKDVTAVPPADQFISQIGITPGHVYIKKTETGKYIKFRVISVADDWMENINGIVIEYHYQTDGATAFSK